MDIRLPNWQMTRVIKKALWPTASAAICSATVFPAYPSSPQFQANTRWLREKPWEDMYLAANVAPAQQGS